MRSPVVLATLVWMLAGTACAVSISAVYFQAGNTLVRNGHWTSTKVSLEGSVPGAAEFFTGRAALRNNRLNLGAHHGFQEVIATSENGFPWQASLGANADKVVFIPEGKTATANSREFKGPVYIARKSSLGEVSFVALGADDDTEARIAAGQAGDDEDLDNEIGRAHV